ncbi:MULTISPECIES: LysR family transcriptional regulator [unclassified Pseudomonas]|uniref:LysR family transcriptional regulator n=1 Tax=unclassified Pseudomonas TaxID=196821 RepID=UPI000BCCEA6A|nr:MULTISPECIES: LysR family transcriptional regulator [unclassified Pseudomonas]PVZ19600.1 DNA-binding transcriptional LysR family regulator [Pseudomonas sp. URIL14HWK12:I12]PVZ22815.1 DNA-binding transcriptional LysR family regulator [Pseudomonas sp. URIL14HWK12:I10]PVZ37555.1 DNA-binding transcriptional LysR family regulator [Pseudomonas sp. URIL14HWK12:I11]SNZ15094.1 DNA-binding transcriptional regulator, LysR family [Pseudomonas sp. URIL14HWK12:I9]
MITIKQVEAVYWVARLRSFEAAADQLNTTQSAVSKRIQDLEARYGQPLFDRSGRRALLTPLGEQVARLAEPLLAQRDVLLQTLESPATLQRKLRLGVTELTALTWLPGLVQGIGEHYPKVEIVPEVDTSPVLFARLESHSIDLIIVPDTFGAHRFASQWLGAVENAWMCAPGLVGDAGELPLARLAERTLALQSSQSGMGRAYGHWFREHGVDISRSVFCNNLLAQIGMVVSGLATSYLPRGTLQQMIDRRKLAVLQVTPVLPPLDYRALYREVEGDPFIADIVEIARQRCDFNRTIMH